MLKFFRRLRYNLLSEGKTGKYFRYAIGEIILVVIGILIALQINNWNEDRKALQKEKIFLSEFENSIDLDLHNYDIQYGPRLKRKKNGLDSLMVYIHDHKEIPDSLFIEYYWQLRQGMGLVYDNGPYEALKSSGVDFIRDDSLRSAINTTYAVLPFFKSFSDQLTEENNARIAELEYKIFQHTSFEQEDGTKHLRYALKVDDIVNNQDFLWIYDLEQRSYNSYRFRLGQMRAALEGLRQKIGKALNTN